MIQGATQGAIDQSQFYIGFGWLATWVSGDGGSQPEPETPARLGGGGGAKKYRRDERYPRRVSIGGTLYTVRNPQELRDLLEMYLADQRKQLDEVETAEAPKEPERKKVKIAIKRTEQRLEVAETEAEQWARRLREYDEEIIALLAH